jgi:5-methylcytosine-specific restriction protein B
MNENTIELAVNVNTKEYVYELYKQFITECILNNNSILTNEQNIFTLTNLQEVKKYFIDGSIKGNGSDYWSKIKNQFKDANYEVRLCFAHLNWLWYLPADDITVNTKSTTPKRILDTEAFKERFNTHKKDNFYPKEGIGSSGQYHKTNKPFEIDFLLLLCVHLKEQYNDQKVNSVAQVNDEIINFAPNLFNTNWYNLDNETYLFLKDKSIAMQSLIMHLAKPNYYEAIASIQDKNAIVQNFKTLITEDLENSEDFKVDDAIYKIKEALIAHGYNQNFYSKQLRPIWQSSLRNNTLEMMSLQYKKAMVLYGPPGTGKTYNANQLAKAFITNHYLHKKENLSNYFTNGLKNIEDRIHLFQFNPNTSYEDFIAGYQLKTTNNGSETLAVKGQLFDIIDKANAETETTDEAGKVKLPHILILDEINRVDLSRVFGELFSAMEYRNKPIQTAVKGISLCIPSNLYIIGTMNEIDFSVERIDFALRRRFVWQFMGYDDAALSQMLHGYFNPNYFEELTEPFVNCCTALNNYISFNIDELGEDYQIGHAFFAEITKIYEEHKNLTGKSRAKKTLFKEAKNILWNISIKPMLVAFLGNTDKETIKEHTEVIAKKFGVGK